MNIISKIAFTLSKEGNANIIDIGCNRGYALEEIRNNFTQRVGLDISWKALQLAKKKDIKASFLLSRAEDLPFKTGSFDVVICAETIEHARESDKVFFEISRVLKKNGKVIITFPVWYTEKIINFFDSNFMKFSGHIKTFSPLEIKNMFNKYNLRIIRKTTYYFEWALMYTIQAIFSNRFSNIDRRLDNYELPSRGGWQVKAELLMKKVVSRLEGYFFGRVLMGIGNFIYPKTCIFLCERNKD